MSHREIIDRLGGHDAVAEFLGCRRNRVVKWKRRGIPPSLFSQLIRLARAKRVELTEKELVVESPAKRLVGRDFAAEARA
jgi:hypothetical protein